MALDIIGLIFLVIFLSLCCIAFAGLIWAAWKIINAILELDEDA